MIKHDGAIESRHGTLAIGQTMIILTAGIDLANGFYEKVVKLFLKFISHFSRRAVDRASIRTRYVGPCFDPLLAAKGWNVAISTSKSPC